MTVPRARRLLWLVVPLAAAVLAPAAPAADVAATTRSDGSVLLVVTGIDARLGGVRLAGRDLSTVRVAGAWPSLAAGAPALPRLPLAVRLPARGTPRAEVVAARWREVAAPPPVPARGNLPRTTDPATVPPTFGPAYAGGVHPAAAWELGRPYRQGGFRGVGLVLHPVRWDADRGRLLVLERLELVIRTGDDPGANPLPMAPTAAWDAAGAQRFVNAAEEDATKYRRVPTGGRMLVVTVPEFVPVLADFAQWKRERGLPVEVATVEDLGGTAEGIAAAVAARWAEPAGLGYLVLAGDLDQVPTLTGTFEGALDDTRYAQVAGDDLYPDLFVSRVSARDTVELRTQLNKFIRYERDPEPGAAWYARAAGVASILGDPTDAQRADWLREDLLGYTFTAVDRLYEPAATGAIIAETLADGRSLLNYLGHGSGSSWSNPAFTVADVDLLANGWRQPWIIDVSCANGRFSDPECFAEAWLRAGTPAQPHGAVAMYSASTTTPWVPPTVMQAEVTDLLVKGKADEIGSLCHHGMMKVLDTYPGDVGRQLVEQYNVFGDCSLQVRTAPPRSLVVTHDGRIAAGVPAYPVEVDAAGAVVAVTAPGRLLGRAVCDERGVALVPLDPPPAAGDALVLTVTGRNLLTRREALPVEVPLAVSADRDSLAVGAVATVHVATAAPVGVTGDVEVALEGWGLVAAPVAVAPGGTAALTVAPAYGEELSLWVREAATGRALHHARLPVTGAAPLPGAVVTAGAPAIAMSGSLTPDVVGEVRGRADVAGLDLHVRGCGVDTTVSSPADSVVVAVVPRWTGELTVALAAPGRTVRATRVPVVVARGTLAGTVVSDGGGAGLHLARVRVWAPGAEEPLLDVMSDEVGRFVLDEDLPLGSYELRVERYGYTTVHETRTLLSGANDWQVPMVVAPRGTAHGLVRAAGSGTPLAATLEIHRLDNGLHVATARAGADGRYVSPELPVGTYDAVLECPGYRPATLAVAVDTDGTDAVHALTPLQGRVLVLGDNLPGGTTHTFPPRLDKHGGPVYQSYAATPSASAVTIWGALLALGYPVVDFVPVAYADPATWPGYDVVVVACGDNPDPLADAGLRTALAARVAAGGRLLLEGGELAAVHGRDPDFARDVLRVACWDRDGRSVATLASTDHALVREPARLFAPPTLDAPGYASNDRVVPGPGATAALTWAEGAAAAVAFDPDPDPAGGQVVFLPLDMQHLGEQERRRLLQNAVEWLRTAPPRDAGLMGRVRWSDGAPAAGATVRLEPGGRVLPVDAGGTFDAADLVPGAYALTVRGGDGTAVMATTSLSAGSVARVADVVLPRPRLVAACREPDAPVPDDDAAGLAAVATVAATGAVAGLQVQVDLDHPWPDDLALDLTSPAGRTAVLRRRGDALRPDPAGTYGDGDGRTDAFLGEEAAGTWLLRVRDEAAADAGRLVSWCLRLTLAAAPPPPPVPPRLVLLGNHPNPFNPDTIIRFSVPSPGPAVVGVHDVRGRRVRVLRHASTAAGVQEVRWDGRDGNGRDLASGVYLLRVEAGGSEATGKMTLLR